MQPIFMATCCGAAHDSVSLTAHMKRAHPRGVMTRSARGAPIKYAGIDPSLRGIKVPASWKCSPTTAWEQEWLGMTVELGDGRLGQVWSGTTHRHGCNVAVAVPVPSTCRLHEIDQCTMCRTSGNELVVTHTDALVKVASIRMEAVQQVPAA